MNALHDLTKMGGDIRQIAKLLQAKAPPGHKLAYINEDEAKLLKRRGGSGRITESGIPSYEEGADVSPPGEASYTPPSGQTSYAPLTDATSSIGNFQGGAATQSAPGVSNFGQGPALGSGAYGTQADSFTAPQFSGPQQVPGSLQSIQPAGTLGSGSFGATAPTELSTALQAPTPAEPSTFGQPAPAAKPSFLDKSLESLQKPENVAKLGLSGLQLGISADQLRRARNQAQSAKGETQALAAPYQQLGQQLTSAATRGELTPANQQILQAAQAQAAQGVASRGGVGTLQAQNQIAALNQQLLSNQFNLGQQTQLVGDKIAQGAIQAGVQADQYINSLTANYTANIARTLYGIGPESTATSQPIYDPRTGQRIS